MNRSRVDERHLAPLRNMHLPHPRTDQNNTTKGKHMEKQQQTTKGGTKPNKQPKEKGPNKTNKHKTKQKTNQQQGGRWPWSEQLHAYMCHWMCTTASNCANPKNTQIKRHMQRIITLECRNVEYKCFLCKHVHLTYAYSSQESATKNVTLRRSNMGT